MNNRLVPIRALALLSAALLFGSSKCADSPKETKSTDQIRQEAEEYFTARLTGSNGLFDDSSVVALADVAREREIIWEAWRSANDNLNEEKLIATDTLELKRSGSLNLPAELEPDAVMPYYWGFKGEKPAGGYPLYLYLHGSGPKQGEWEAGYRLARQFDDAPSLYFIPQIPNESIYRWYPRSKQYAYEKVMRQALARGDADPDRIYFFGISEGAYGSQRLASFYADYLAGAGPMAGGEPLKNAPVENCRNMAFSLRTGDRDVGFYRNTLTQYTKDEFERLQAASPGSFVHWIELIPGMGHSIDYKPTTPWLSRHVRNPYPKTVTWENFEMDGRYRDGFYNIYVDERSNDDQTARTYYRMEIDGNHITLDVDLVRYETVEKDQRWGIEMKFARSYEPATKGKVTIYLGPELVDLSQPVTLTVNGKEVFRGELEAERRHMVNSCAAFFDPRRIYPAAIEVDLSDI